MGHVMQQWLYWEDDACGIFCFSQPCVNDCGQGPTCTEVNNRSPLDTRGYKSCPIWTAYAEGSQLRAQLSGVKDAAWSLRSSTIIITLPSGGVTWKLRDRLSTKPLGLDPTLWIRYLIGFKCNPFPAYLNPWECNAECLRHLAPKALLQRYAKVCPQLTQL